MPGEVRVCGLGLDPRREATVEALQALEGCAPLLTDLPRLPPALERLLGPARRASGAAEAVAQAQAGATVGLAVWGHPSYTSALGAEALSLCRARGVACRLVPGVSPVASVLARAARFLGGEGCDQGAQARELRDFLRGGSWDEALPLVVFAREARPGDWEALASRLGERYARGHRALVCPALEEGARETELGGLGSRGPAWGAVLVPPIPGGRRRPR